MTGVTARAAIALILVATTLGGLAVAGEAGSTGEKLWKSGAVAGGKEPQYLVVQEAAGEACRKPEKCLDAAGYVLNKWLIYMANDCVARADIILDTSRQHA